jgi:hypothetical protein
MPPKPKSFEEAQALINHRDLGDLIKAQLIFIGFKHTDATAFRALEMLFNMPRDEENDEIDDLSSEDLVKLRAELREVYEKYI